MIQKNNIFSIIEFKKLFSESIKTLAKTAPKILNTACAAQPLVQHDSNYRSLLNSIGTLTEIQNEKNPILKTHFEDTQKFMRSQLKSINEDVLIPIFGIMMLALIVVGFGYIYFAWGTINTIFATAAITGSMEQTLFQATLVYRSAQARMAASKILNFISKSMALMNHKLILYPSMSFMFGEPCYHAYVEMPNQMSYSSQAAQLEIMKAAKTELGDENRLMNNSGLVSLQKSLQAERSGFWINLIITAALMGIAPILRIRASFSAGERTALERLAGKNSAGTKLAAEIKTEETSIRNVNKKANELISKGKIAVVQRTVPVSKVTELYHHRLVEFFKDRSQFTKFLNEIQDLIENNLMSKNSAQYYQYLKSLEVPSVGQTLPNFLKAIDTNDLVGLENAAAKLTASAKEALKDRLFTIGTAKSEEYQILISKYRADRPIEDLVFVMDDGNKIIYESTTTLTTNGSTAKTSKNLVELNARESRSLIYLTYQQHLNEQLSALQSLKWNLERVASSGAATDSEVNALFNFFQGLDKQQNYQLDDLLDMIIRNTKAEQIGLADQAYSNPLKELKQIRQAYSKLASSVEKNFQPSGPSAENLLSPAPQIDSHLLNISSEF